jgi:16S rRNA (cytosine1402-N4)-methyltransferase
MSLHAPVLYDEVLDALSPRAGGSYVDGTLGEGGHARGILERSAPDGRLLGLDLDRETTEAARASLADYGRRVTVVHGSYARMAELVRQSAFQLVDGVLLDLGMSSRQLASAQRGFSFQLDGPLDMRFDESVGPPASHWVNSLPEDELADALFEYGEERESRRIARAIVRARPVLTTVQLAALVASAVRNRGRAHPATKTFQALRLLTNGELDTVATGLEQALKVLAPGARLVVISFHSLEDRIVKRFLLRSAERTEADRPPALKVITRHPVVPSAAEKQRNPRSRSAKMRVAERLLATQAYAEVNYE